MSEAVIDAVYSAAVPGICSWASCRCEGGSRAIRDSEVKCDENNEVKKGNEVRRDGDRDFIPGNGCG